MNARMKHAALAVVVDELGLVKHQISELKKKEEALREQVLAAGLDEVAGETFVATVSRGEKLVFGTKRFSEDHPKLYEQYSELVEFEQLRVKAR